MNMATFDTLAYARRLRAADVAGLKTGIANLRADLYRATWVQAGIVAAVMALVKLLP